MATDEGKDRNETQTLNKEMKLEWLYKVGPERELNSWPVSSVGQSVGTEFSGRGFKSHSGQLSIATSKSPSMVNTIYMYIYYIYINILYIYIYIYIYIYSGHLNRKVTMIHYQKNY